jgi:electron transport complex protein RnfC
LDQHIGTPAQPVVKAGDRVKKYDLVGRASGKISSNVHASLNGIIKDVSNNEVIIQRL